MALGSATYVFFDTWCHCLELKCIHLNHFCFRACDGVGWDIILIKNHAYILRWMAHCLYRMANDVLKCWDSSSHFRLFVQNSHSTLLILTYSTPSPFAPWLPPPRRCMGVQLSIQNPYMGPVCAVSCTAPCEVRLRTLVGAKHGFSVSINPWDKKINKNELKNHDR